MKKYRILIVGFGCYYGHIREFAINLKKKNPNVDITMALRFNTLAKTDGLTSYIDHLIQCDGGPSSYVGMLPKHLYLCYRYIFFYYHLIALGLKGKFDIVDIHFANSGVKFYMRLFKMISKNIVISPWGSDVLRVEGEKNIKELAKIYSYARYVTTGKDTQSGKRLISTFNVSPEKLVKLGWGGEFFDYIEKNSNHMTTEDAKERFGLKGRYVITCGYNTQKEQRHEDIINAIYKVKDQLPQNLTLLFPFTYGRSPIADSYIGTLEEKCKELKIDYMAVKDHLDLPDLHKLRMATDIFVHVQTSDAGSRCVAEYILCNKKVVHGAWMKYSYLEGHKLSNFFLVEKMEQLSDCILNAYQADVEDLSQEVRNVLMERSWNHKMTLWNSFFESLTEKE